MARCKYYKEIRQVSHDGGQTWNNVSPAEYQKGELYESNSPDCTPTPLYRWTVVDGGFICENGNKYQKLVFQQSNDGGATYYNTYPTTYETGSVIETDSDDCNYKWEGHYGANINCGNGYTYVYGKGCVYTGGGGSWSYKMIVDPIKIILCTDNSTELTRTDVDYYGMNLPLLYGYIGDCVTSIGTSAFAGCTSLPSITIPDSVTSIGENAFRYCTGLTSVNIPSGVTTIGQFAFTNCYSLPNITIGNNVETIGRQAFTNCTSLETATIGSGNMGQISGFGYDNAAFSGCTNLREVTFGNNVDIIGVMSFMGCYNLESVTIGNADIGTHAFSGCSSLSSVTFSNEYSGTMIHHGAFRECGMTDIIIPNSVVFIGSNVFNRCTGLTSITIGSGVTEIGNYAFSQCSNLTSFTILAETPPTLSQADIFLYSANCPIYVPCNSVNAYKSAWSLYSGRIAGLPPCG